MNGFKFKVTAITSILFSMTLSHSLASTALNHNEKQIYNTQAGCMSCHQSEANQSDYTSKKNKKLPIKKYLRA